ncbi:alpha/beta fold hydrolase [Levilactobacillus senmaizukei]|nr:alpha/beta fold hydrolase [Levilactobacillus senmaizukei]
MKHRRGLIITLTLIVILGALAGWWHSRWQILKHTQVPTTRTATLFLPGTQGAWLSLRSMVVSLNRPHLGHFTLTAKVAFNGSVTWDSHGTFDPRNPLIPVIFKDNTHPRRQAEQLRTVLTVLHRHYGIDHVNFVGHSSGGTIAYDYLNQSQPAPVTVDRLVCLGADFPERTPLRYHYPQLHILNLAGSIGRLGNDSEVPVNTATPMKHLVQGKVASYHFQKLTGPIWNTQHSLLHENPAVDRLMIHFLYPPI